MKKGTLFLLCSVLIVIFSYLVLSGSMEFKDGSYEVNVFIDEGWNLVAGTVPQSGILQGSVVQLSNIKAVWYYSPIQKKYLQVHPNFDDGFRNEDDDFVLSNAMWVYSDKAGLLKYKTLEDYPSDERQLYSGWNFVSMTPDFVETGKYPDVKLEELKGNCNFEKVYYYTREEWHEFDMLEMDASLI